MTHSTEQDIVERARRSLDPFWAHVRTDVIVGMMAEITQLRVERDAAALDMRERCAKVADDQALTWVNGQATTAIGQSYQRACNHTAIAIRALSLAVIATDREASNG